MTRTTPLRRMILHLRQILFTDALTFIVALPGSASAAVFYIARNVIRPFVRSYGTMTSSFAMPF